MRFPTDSNLWLPAGKLYSNGGKTYISDRYKGIFATAIRPFAIDIPI